MNEPSDQEPNFRAQAATAAEPAPVSSQGALRRLLPRVVIGMVLAVVVLSGLALFGDVRQLGTAFREFRWWLLVPALLLTLWNYAIRFVKWQIYLRRLGITELPRSTSGLIFLSGFSMAITPGKVGELIKAVLLREQTGAPVNRTSAIIAAERLSDGFAMLILAGIGLTQFSYARPFLLGAAVVAIILVLLLQRPQLVQVLLDRAADWPLVGPFVHHGSAFLAASNELNRPGLLLTAIGLGIISWAGECVAFYLVLVGLGIPASFHLLLVGTFVLAVSSLVGAVSMLPGGLGIADASVTGMLLILLPGDEITRSLAVAATIIIRIATLWFGVLIGFVALAILRRRTTRQTSLSMEPSA